MTAITIQSSAAIDWCCALAHLPVAPTPAFWCSVRQAASQLYSGGSRQSLRLKMRASCEHPKLVIPLSARLTNSRPSCASGTSSCHPSHDRTPAGCRCPVSWRRSDHHSNQGSGPALEKTGAQEERLTIRQRAPLDPKIARGYKRSNL